MTLPAFAKAAAATEAIQDETLYLAEANIESMESGDHESLELKLTKFKSSVLRLQQLQLKLSKVELSK